MIFDNTLTEQQIVENFIKEGGEGKGFIFKSYYDEENNKIILSNLYYDENNIMHEANISQKQLGMPKVKKQNPRYIMITGGSTSGHAGRMKVSAPGVTIDRGNKSKYISIYRKDKDTITYKSQNPGMGYKDIGMSNAEYKQYEDLFKRNENLIQFARSHPEYEQYIDAAMIHDENMRNKGYIVNRDKISGNAIVLSGNDCISYKNIKGENI